MKDTNNEWSQIIESKSASLSLDLKEIWRYRDLIYLFVHRDFVAQYKQTILGPAWHIIQPLLTTLMFTIVFGKIAKIPTDGLPPFLFYMAGTVIWTYFASVVTATSSTFTGNAHIFGKVYFPRLAIPIASLFSKLISFAIQFVFFLAFLAYFKWSGADIHMQASIFLTPILLLLMAALGLGVGVIISALTTRYRDLTVLVSFAVQLWMYATPIIYPLSSLSEKWQFWASLNPAAPIVEIFRYSFLGVGTFNLTMLAVCALTTSILLLLGIILFNRVERTFMDTV